MNSEVRYTPDLLDAAKSANGYLTGLRGSLVWHSALGVNFATVNLVALEMCIGEIRNAIRNAEGGEAA